MSGARAEGLTVEVDGTAVLHDVSLSVDAGQWVTVTGPSGAGKSVLLQALAGLLPAEGTIDVGAGPPGVVLQDYALLPLLTAFETVALPLQARRAPREEISSRVSTALDGLGLATTTSQLVSTLSGGQRQRVAIARALAPEPDVLLLDEPTAEIDPDNRVRVLGLLRRHTERGAAVLVVTHDPVTIEASDVVVELTAGGRPARN